MPDEREVRGLLALILLTDARRETRVGPDGRMLLLEEQDRSRWDLAAIEEGTQLVVSALRRGQPGRFALQAAIAALHAQSARASDTDWREIAALYTLLHRLYPSPVVALNRAAAVGMAEGPERGLALIAALEAEGLLEGYHLLAAAKADLLRRLGRAGEAATAYAQALAQAGSEVERRYLRRRLRELGGPSGGGSGP